jgi:hypothetical protein
VSYPTNSVEYQAVPTSETCGFDVLVVGGGIAGV